jgi:hypothetical protein
LPHENDTDQEETQTGNTQWTESLLEKSRTVQYALLRKDDETKQVLLQTEIFALH